MSIYICTICQEQKDGDFNCGFIEGREDEEICEECSEAKIQSEEQIVYLVAIIERNTEYEDVKNYLFEQRKDAINLIEKHYYLKPVKNSPRKWQNNENNINAILTELFIRGSTHD